MEGSLVGGAWFAVGFVLLIPEFGLLFYGCGLGARHSVGQDFRQILAVGLAAGAGQHRPEVGFVWIFWQAVVAAPIEQSQLVLRGDVAMLGCFGKPSGGFRVVWLDGLLFVALGVEKSEGIFCRGIALHGKLSELGEIVGIDGGIDCG